MLFEKKDSFTKNLNQLLQVISHAEKLMRNINDDNIQGLNEVKKTLEQAPKLLESLYRDISVNKPIWDKLTLKQRNGQYDNLFTRYKEIQQQLDDLRWQPRLSS